jgi:hypothetical protein
MILLGLLLLSGGAACQKAAEPSTPTPDQASIQAASTLFAQPSPTPRITQTPTPVNAVELDLNRAVARMEQAVLAGDYESYMAYVWDGDPIFWNEHSRWAQDWQTHPLRVFEITLYGIQEAAADKATARMTIIWAQRGTAGEGSSGGATISAVFYLRDGRWLFGGEDWQALATQGIRFYYFSNDILDNRPQAEMVAEYLPDIYSRLTHEFGFVPEHTAEIKMYESTATLQTMTRLSMPAISVWNEPGEAIKLTLGPSNTAPREPDIAREYAQFLVYELGGGTHGSFPWWLEDGIAEYGSLLFRTLSYRNRTLRTVAALAQAPEGAERHLVEWDVLDNPAALDDTARQVVPDQVFTLLHYITETYGTEKRNAWIQAIASGQTLGDACQMHLGTTFVELAEAWREWLPSQM